MYNVLMKSYFEHKLKNLINVSKIVTIHYFEFEKNFKTEGDHAFPGTAGGGAALSPVRKRHAQSGIRIPDARQKISLEQTL